MELLFKILNSQLLAAIVSIIITYFIIPSIPPFASKKLEWNKGMKTFSLSVIFMIIFIVSREYLAPLIYINPTIKKEANYLINNNKWLTYDPSDFNPLTGQIPSRGSIEKDLMLISKVGFDGIITFNSNSYMKVVPELAKKHSLKIIIGIWNPNNPIELINAIALKKNCEGYCIGHNGLNKIYDLSDLKNAIHLIRFYTRKPVSTTEMVKDYSTDIIELVDWIFPDFHINPTNDSINISRDVSITINSARMINSINIKHKPILLKMVMYPIKGIANASYENQKKYFEGLLESKRDPFSGLATNVSIATHNLTDESWKVNWPYYEWEAHTGLIEEDTIFRPALASIIELMNY
jgi:exo-beta-1,3-glucanase (GH17 family)